MDAVTAVDLYRPEVSRTRANTRERARTRTNAHGYTLSHTNTETRIHTPAAPNRVTDRQHNAALAALRSDADGGGLRARRDATQAGGGDVDAPQRRVRRCVGSRSATARRRSPDAAARARVERWREAGDSSASTRLCRGSETATRPRTRRSRGRWVGCAARAPCTSSRTSRTWCRSCRTPSRSSGYPAGFQTISRAFHRPRFNRSSSAVCRIPGFKVRGRANAYHTHQLQYHASKKYDRYDDFSRLMCTL